MLRIAEGRKKRNIDPTFDLLRLVADNVQYDHKVSPIERQQIDELVSFVEVMTKWYGEMMPYLRTNFCT